MHSFTHPFTCIPTFSRRTNILKEVQALSHLSDNPYIVRYYSSWIEDAILFVQMEFCAGGNLTTIRERRRMSQEELIGLLRQMATGLHHMHSSQLVHLDIKPENIYIVSEGRYKIGDLGLVTSALDNRCVIDEGDSRYLASELLDDVNSWSSREFSLPMVDIFSLGATIYEMALGEELPPNGQEWHDIRNGKLKPLPHLSKDFCDLLRSMLNRSPALRPSTGQILQHPLIASTLRSAEDLEEQVHMLESLLEQKEVTIRTLREKLESLQRGQK